MRVRVHRERAEREPGLVRERTDRGGDAQVAVQRDPAPGVRVRAAVAVDQDVLRRRAARSTRRSHRRTRPRARPRSCARARGRARRGEDRARQHEQPDPRDRAEREHQIRVVDRRRSPATRPTAPNAATADARAEREQRAATAARSRARFRRARVGISRAGSRARAEAIGGATPRAVSARSSRPPLRSARCRAALRAPHVTLAPMSPPLGNRRRLAGGDALPGWFAIGLYVVLVWWATAGISRWSCS